MDLALQETAPGEITKDLPYMRVLQAPPLTPVFLLEDWEIGKTKALPVVTELHFGLFIDDRLRVHFELNHGLRPLPPVSWRDLLNPMRRYLSMASHLIGQSFLKTERRLIGGLHAIYFAQGRQTAVSTTGVLHREEIPDIDPSVRAVAFDVISQRLHELNRWLGADSVHSGPTVIPDRVMKRIGWKPYRLRKWKNIKTFYRACFPMCLRRKIGLYVVRYREGAEIEP